MLLKETCPKTYPDTLRGGDSWHMKHCIIYTHSTRSMPLSLPVCLKKWPRCRGCELQINLDVRQRPGCAAGRKRSLLKANTSLSLVVPQACRGWCQRCRHWTEKASSLGERVIRIFSESATRYSSTAYICANGNPAHWPGSLKCEMYVRAWAKGVRRNVSGLKIFLLFLSFYLFMLSGWRVSPKRSFPDKWLFIQLYIMSVCVDWSGFVAVLLFWEIVMLQNTKAYNYLLPTNWVKDHIQSLMVWWPKHLTIYC